MAEAIRRNVLVSEDARSSCDDSPVVAKHHDQYRGDLLSLPQDLNLFPHQIKAISKWGNAGGKGILKIATGGGKTVAALAAVCKIAQRVQGPLAVVIVAPLINLVDQWLIEASRFGLMPIRCAEGADAWTQDLIIQKQAYNAGLLRVLSIVSTNSTFFGSGLAEIVADLHGTVLLICDEVHNLRGESSILKLPSNASLRIGLSATPEDSFSGAPVPAYYDYFNGVVFTYGLEEAIRDGVLVPYLYYPTLIELLDEEVEEYLRLSKMLARYIHSESEEFSPQAKSLLLRRARLIGTASNKERWVRGLLSARKNGTRTLIYCGDGTVAGDEESSLIRQVDRLYTLVTKEISLIGATYTSRTSTRDRQVILDKFRDGLIGVLVAIRCLDEGVDIPAVDTAIMLASSTNPRQFVQRRGRVLRRFPGKAEARIFDTIVVPPAQYARFDGPEFQAAKRLLIGQFKRVNEFAGLAINGPEARAEVLSYADRLGLLGQLEV
ncbi:MAG: DEAD/DEAH box helicase family protein [Krumholzibacteria bacterium]|nr:DEAD/DEAH box helicase family protein [Candidatus Krumholzibacteria bacterium]